MTLPAGVMAVGFHPGINSDPVASRIHVVLATSDKGEQTFIVDGRGTERLSPSRSRVCRVHFRPTNLNGAVPCSGHY